MKQEIPCTPEFTFKLMIISITEDKSWPSTISQTGKLLRMVGFTLSYQGNITIGSRRATSMILVRLLRDGPLNTSSIMRQAIGGLDLTTMELRLGSNQIIMPRSEPMNKWPWREELNAWSLMLTNLEILRITSN